MSRFLGVHPESLRQWVKQRESGAVLPPGAMPASVSLRVRALEREVRNLRRAVEALQATTAVNERPVTLIRPAAAVKAVSDHSSAEVVSSIS